MLVLALASYELSNCLFVHAIINICMRINEFASTFHTYLSTVRVVLRNGSTTVRTTITADTVQQARSMLTRIYGENNVLSISEVVNESGQAHENNAQASHPRQLRRRQHGTKKNAPAVFSCVVETDNTARVLSPAELQVKSLSDKAKQYTQQAKQLKARQSLAKAQQKMRQAGAGS